MRAPGQSYWTILLFGLIGYPHSLQAVDLRAVVGLEYDDNPFESSSKKKSPGWSTGSSWQHPGISLNVLGEVFISGIRGV